MVHVKESPTGDPCEEITFSRLTEVPLGAVQNLLNEPRNRRHMPLAGDFSEAAAARWVGEKDAQWDRNGYGPLAVHIGGQFAGWGGFQRELDGADFGLVLAPRYWGCGRVVASLLLAQGFDVLCLDEVLVALPRTRRPAVLQRFGLQRHGQVSYGDAVFEQYRLSRTDWLRLRTDRGQAPR
jgi:hypothetical protein